MLRKRKMLMIVPCRAHSGVVLNMLDRERIADWLLVPTDQSRRTGALEFLPADHEETCDAILGMTDAAGASETLERLAKAIHDGRLCVNCLAYVWDATEAVLSQTAVDPVCGMAVERETAVTADYGGRAFHYCCDECRERFKEFPETYAHVRAGTP